MTAPGPHDADRLQAFIAALDSYEPGRMAAHADLFRVFARFISRSIDGRYLDRHPPAELLPDLEQLLEATRVRPAGSTTVQLVVQDDAQIRRGVLVTCMPDQRFIYSIVRLALDSLGLRHFRAINGVVPVTRDADGAIAHIGGADAPRESFIWVEVDADEVERRGEELRRYLVGRLEAAQAVVEDFTAITALIAKVAGTFEKLAARPNLPAAGAYAGNARLLRWLLGDHFVFLGTRTLGTHTPPGPSGGAQPDAGLGVGRLADWRGMAIPPKLLAAAAAQPAPLLRVHKSQTEAWLYRPGRTDQIWVPLVDDAGSPSGTLVVEGIFSYAALSEARTAVPLLDAVIEQIFENLEATKGSHRYRTVRNAFNSLPLEYLFSLSPEDVGHLIEQVLDVDAVHRPQIHISANPDQHIAFVFVAMPRSHYSDDLRTDVRRLLAQRFGASAVDDGMYAGNFESIALHFFLTGAGALDAAGQAALRQEIDELASPWTERLEDALLARHGRKQGRQLYALYAQAFSARYREETSIARAVDDIGIMEAIGPDHLFECDIYREGDDAHLGIARLRMFQGARMLLSDILPILDNFGLVVIDQFPTPVQVPGRAELTVATFRIGGVQGMDLDLTSRRNRLRNAIRAVVRGAMTSDPLNRLLLRADLAWPSVVLVAALQSYARQIGMPYGQATVQEALLHHADIVRSLVELFFTKFDPHIDGEHAPEVDDRRRERVERARRALLMQLDDVEDLTSDQVLRTLYNLVDSTLRTNFFARDPDRDWHLVLKLDPSQVSRMPDPRPYREIYVYHPQVAGLHLRGGPIARGGIRWSDRLLDFRTEVLGLMATQNLKNVLIVPRGAKGAFVLRFPPPDMAERRAFADEMYKVFIGGLLDVTDNLENGQPVTPGNIVRYDGHDHYLVVAADKGTAHLSDTANQLAAGRNFWLGDAFASGGSKGYDHKKEAITSRGAWACVRRHFHEIEVDPEKDPIRIVGIGDMSGDVFGNGLLRSRSCKLVAAFDHRHFFIDPDPDPARSFAARKALFDRPRSSWEDYDRAAMSPGSGIYPRGAKSIKLSAEARQALGIAADAPLSGPELVRAILCAPVDLLWNGGIGTYIKASAETHLDAGDPANDSVRVDAPDVRVKVIGEGGNLGITAAGRVELASQGVRLNTDAVDNSAGVDMSDHEVNLKILFQHAADRGAVTGDERDRLLEQVRVEVGEKVVGNNWLQSRMLSLDELRARRDPARFQRAIAFLAERVPFKKRDAGLPGERLSRVRAQKGDGLFRPELAFLAANAKLDLRQQLGAEQADFPLSGMQDFLIGYFPPSLRQRFAADIAGHPLALNIARTMLTNAIVGDAGVSWLAEVTQMTGRPTAEIVRAYFDASRLLGAGALKEAADALSARLPAAAEYRLRLTLEDAIEEVATWLLRHPGEASEAFAAAFAQVLAVAPAPASPDDASRSHTAALAAAGAAPDLIAHAAALPQVGEALDVATLSTHTRVPPAQAARAYDVAGTRTGALDLVRRALAGGGADDTDRPARHALREQLRGHLNNLAASLLADGASPDAPPPATLKWMEALRHELAPLGAGEPPLSALVLAAERVGRAAARLERRR